MSESGCKLLLTIREVAELTGLAVGSIYHLVSQQRIPFIRLSRRCIRFRRSDLEGWIDGLHQPARGEAGRTQYPARRDTGRAKT